MPTDNDKIMEKLTEFHSEFTEFRGEMKVRVHHIEDDMKDAKKWENYKVYAILPLAAGLHAIAHKLGILKG